jgi:hypothetical protein
MNEGTMSDDISSITPEDFVQEFKILKDCLLKGYFTKDSDISRLDQLTSAGLNVDQIHLVKEIFNDSFTDAFYTVLMGLEGEASIGNHQMSYKLFDENGNELTGELECLAWEKFHGESN